MSYSRKVRRAGVFERLPKMLKALFKAGCRLSAWVAKFNLVCTAYRIVPHVTGWLTAENEK